MGGVTVYDHVSECHVTFRRGGLHNVWWDPISTIELPEGRFKTFLDISLPEKLTWKSRRYQNKTFITGASPGIPYEPRDKHTKGWRRWYIATQERKVCDMEVEIVTFVVKGPSKRDRPSRSAIRLLSRMTFFYMSYYPLLKLSFPDFSLPSCEILTYNYIYIWICHNVL